MPRPQFTLRAMLLVAALFGGRAGQWGAIRQFEKRTKIAERRETIAGEIQSRQAGMLIEHIEDLQAQLGRIESRN
ncbi:MAG TPA: hypothetical protein VHC22_10605 [Pirellulales bacterium]|nr:hypothetical protein [Pirellulales bacterium]